MNQDFKYCDTCGNMMKENHKCDPFDYLLHHLDLRRQELFYFKKLDFKIIKAMVRNQIIDRINFATKKMAEKMKEVDRLRESGMSFKERISLLNDEGYRRWEKMKLFYSDLLKYFKINPFENWIEVGDLEEMKKVGIKKFIDKNFLNICLK